MSRPSDDNERWGEYEFIFYFQLDMINKLKSFFLYK